MSREMDLCELPDGTLMIVTDRRLPAEALRIEYYRDQRLLMLIYDKENHEGDLMHHELPQDVVRKVILARRIIVVAYSNDNEEPDQFSVPLIQIGV